MYFKTATTELELQRCYRLRYQVYCEEKRWLNAADYPEKLEKDDYDSHAVHVMAYDDEFELVGIMRILRRQDFSALPFESHPGMKGKSVMARNIVELSRFMVTTKKNRMEVTRGLIRAVYQTSVALGADNWILVIEPSLRRLLSMLEFKFSPLCQPVNYYGGFTEVVLANIKQTTEYWKTEKPDVARYYLDENAMVQPAVAV